jgi:hypothetical protein
VLKALLAAAAAHKSAAAVSAATSCLLSLCQAAPDVREQLGQLPGARTLCFEALKCHTVAVSSPKHSSQDSGTSLNVCAQGCRPLVVSHLRRCRSNHCGPPGPAACHRHRLGAAAACTVVRT